MIAAFSGVSKRSLCGLIRTTLMSFQLHTFSDFWNPGLLPVAHIGPVLVTSKDAVLDERVLAFRFHILANVWSVFNQVKQRGRSLCSILGTSAGTFVAPARNLDFSCLRQCSERHYVLEVSV